MQECMQFKNQSVLDHGISVKNYLFDLLGHLKNGSPLRYEWKIPSWVHENKEFLLSNIHDDEILKSYTVFHDCGKPYCKIIDSEGKSHFPDHANISSNIYESVFPNDTTVKNLIRMDIDIHMLKSDQIEEFSRSMHASTLLLVGLSEIHSNATMFGGLESVSFKIKWKHIDKRGRQVLSMINTH